jgi:hypothetical protein
MERGTRRKRGDGGVDPDGGEEGERRQRIDDVADAVVVAEVEHGVAPDGDDKPCDGQPRGARVPTPGGDDPRDRRSRGSTGAL